jgi:hypothetical protein
VYWASSAGFAVYFVIADRSVTAIDDANADALSSRFGGFFDANARYTARWLSAKRQYREK